ncbi:MAG: hypothetical protein R6V05_14545 [Candidatus Brocadiia bacterium]
MSAPFEPGLMTTGIGSLPLTDPDRAAEFVLAADLSAAFWPQLPRRRFYERMVPQFAELVPAVRLDEQEEAVRWEPDAKYDELGGFYERYLADDPSLFGLSGRVAAGFEAFRRAAGGHGLALAKGQVTGPITFCTSVTSADGEPLYGDEEMRQVVSQALGMNARWQVAQLSQIAGDGVIVFVDEPVLAVFGSSALAGVSEAHVRELDGHVLAAVEDAGALSGMHVCGNSDWAVVARSGVSIVNFDAYQYGHTISLYPEAVGELLERGGAIAWGIVPTTDAIRQEDADSLARRFEKALSELAGKGFEEDYLRRRSLLTPSCGAGAMSEEDARRVFRVLAELHTRLRR